MVRLLKRVRVHVACAFPRFFTLRNRVWLPGGDSGVALGYSGPRTEGAAWATSNAGLEAGARGASEAINTNPQYEHTVHRRGFRSGSANR